MCSSKCYPISTKKNTPPKHNVTSSVYMALQRGREFETKVTAKPRYTDGSNNCKYAIKMYHKKTDNLQSPLP